MKRFLVVQHSYSEFLGTIEKELETRDIGFAYQRPFTGQALPASALQFDALWLLGRLPGHRPRCHALDRRRAQPRCRIPAWAAPGRGARARCARRRRRGGRCNNPNTIKSLYELQAVYCPHLSSTTQYVVMSEDFPGDFYFMEVDAPKFEEESDFDRHGLKIKSGQIFALGIKDFIHVVNNAGA